MRLEPEGLACGATAAGALFAPPAMRVELYRVERAGVVLGSCWMDLTLEHVGVVLLQHISSTPPTQTGTSSARPPPPSCWSVLALCQHHSNTTPAPHQHGSESHSVLLDESEREHERGP